MYKIFIKCLKEKNSKKKHTKAQMQTLEYNNFNYT